MFAAVKTFAKENPTMILTLCYFLITAIGIGYSFFFYREFDINIIKFADLSDFLLAAILEPLSLVMFGFIVLIMLFAYAIDLFLRKRFNFYHNLVENRLKAKYTDPIVIIIVVLVFTIVLMQDLAIENADRIKNKGKDIYQVSFSQNDSGESIKNFELLGSTSRFVYFYDPENKLAVVISPENLNHMIKPITEKKASKAVKVIPQQIKESKKPKE